MNMTLKAQMVLFLFKFTKYFLVYCAIVYFRLPPHPTLLPSPVSPVFSCLHPLRCVFKSSSTFIFILFIQILVTQPKTAMKCVINLPTLHLPTWPRLLGKSYLFLLATEIQQKQTSLQICIISFSDENDVKNARPIHSAVVKHSPAIKNFKINKKLWLDIRHVNHQHELSSKTN